MFYISVIIISELKRESWLSDSYYDVIFTALRGEYNSQPFVFKNKMAVSRFAQVSDEEISEMSFSLFFNSEIILKQLFASG